MAGWWIPHTQAAPESRLVFSRLVLVLPFDRTRLDVWVSLALRSRLHFKRSQAKLINQPISDPITSSYVVTAKWRSGRCGYTGSCGCRPALRQFRLFRRSLPDWSKRNVQQSSECLSSSLMDSTAHLQNINKGLEKKPQTLPAPIHRGLQSVVGDDLAQCGRKKKAAWNVHTLIDREGHRDTS